MSVKTAPSWTCCTSDHCEVDDSFCMDPEDLAKKITPRTKLILPVHMAGAPCDMKAIMAIAKKQDVPVLEDCAPANGGSFRGKKVGTFGSLGMFSFQWNKNATAGEGGKNRQWLLFASLNRNLERRILIYENTDRQQHPVIIGVCEPRPRRRRSLALG